MSKELREPAEIAGFIIAKFPSIGFLSARKRFAAFQWMAVLLQIYKDEGGDFISAFDLVVDNFNPAKKAFAQAYIYKDRLRVDDLSVAAFEILYLYR